MKRPSQYTFVAACTTALAAVLATSPAQAVDPNKVIDLRAQRLRVTGATSAGQVLQGATWVPKVTVRAGATIDVVCDWSAHLVGAAYSRTKVKQTIQIVLQRDEHTFATRNGVIPAGKELGGKQSVGVPLPFLNTGHSTNLGDHAGGSTEPAQWTAADPGEHRFSCVIPETGFDEPTLENNVAHVVVVVEAAQAAYVTKSPPVGKPVQAVAPARVPPALRRAGADAALPDLVSESALVVGKHATHWGATVQVDASEARRVHAGFCEFPIRHTVRNGGAGGAAASGRRWTNDHVSGQWNMQYPPIGAQAAVERVDTLPLAPGRNVLYLALDPHNALTESSTANNLRRIAVEVSGSCGAALPAKKSFLPSRW
jgi:hypothetical protein